MIYNITPVPKPRMTQRDKWKKRPCVLRYRAFKDECREQKVELPEGGAHVAFYIEMPRSWSKKKKAEMDLKPHQQRPDVDNLLKSLMDAIFTEDCQVYDVRVTKVWSYKPSITINIG